jgi:hypothetical protein
LWTTLQNVICGGGFCENIRLISHSAIPNFLFRYSKTCLSLLALDHTCLALMYVRVHAGVKSNETYDWLDSLIVKCTEKMGNALNWYKNAPIMILATNKFLLLLVKIISVTRLIDSVWRKPTQNKSYHKCVVNHYRIWFISCRVNEIYWDDWCNRGTFWSAMEKKQIIL